MPYFFLSSKLLNEASFYRAVSNINADFMSYDETRRDDGGNTELNLKSWLTKSKDPKTVMAEDGVEQNFRDFALSRLRTYLTMDIDNYVNEFRKGKYKDSTDFFQEVATVAEYIKNANYLLPVKDEMLAVLDNIPKDIRSGEKSVAAVSVKEIDDALTWNGDLDALIGLFAGLRTDIPDGLDKPYLNYSSDQLGEFIYRHFRDAGGKHISRDAIKSGLLHQNEAKKIKKSRAKG